MGLDMYLNAEYYVSKYARPAVAQKIREMLEIPDSGNIESLNVSAEIGYWRKANAIHGWFNSISDSGVENCERMSVDRGELEELRTICKSLLESRDVNKAMELLPPTRGFFFGADEIGIWYWEDLERTVEIVDRALALPESVYFSYRASW